MRVLLAGESWVSAATDFKGFDDFTHTQVEIGCAELLEALRNNGHDVTHMYSHDVAKQFPESRDGLADYDVVILSDVGANTLLLHPDVFGRGTPRPNRLHVLAEWVRAGGGLAMAGGYLSFQGFQGKANYHGTAIEDILPVEILPYDDRQETPQGVSGRLTSEQHEITAGLDEEWPLLLGYQRLTAKPRSTVLATVENRPLLAVSSVERGRTLAFASDISPHWATPDFMAWGGYGRLFGQAVEWLGSAASQR